MAKSIIFYVSAVIGLTACLQHSVDAGMSLRLSDGVASTGTITSGTNSISFSGTVGRYNVALTAGSANVPGESNPTGGFLEVITLTVRLNTSNAVGTRTLSIDLAADDYDAPASDNSPMRLDSSGSVTFAASTAGSDSWAFQSWADGSNSGAFRAGTATDGVSIMSPGGNPSSLSKNDNSTSFTRGPFYSLSSLTTITLVSTMSSVGTTGKTVATAVPEPGTLAMTGLALPLLGLCYRRRRSRA